MSCNLISECLKTAAQTTAALALTDTCTVYKLKPIGTGDGFRNRGSERYPDDYIAHLTDEPCAIFSNPKPTERISGGQPRMIADWEIYFRAGTDVDEKYIVKATSLNNRIFRLTGPMTASMEVLRIYEAQEVR